ncbi:MAG TPA: hypothetical protein VJR92_01345 [Gemmatimonadaceae bacterium]|nr:hypothetical protein [Gemmatimonadaceae bacterium]
MSRTRSNRDGMVLIDVIVGTAILASAGVACIALLGQHFASVKQLQMRETEMTAVDAQLERISALWTARDFEARLGATRLGSFDATVRALAPGLFEVSLADTLRGVVILSSSFYTGPVADVAR